MRAARGGKLKRGGTSTTGGGGALSKKLPIALCYSLSFFLGLGFLRQERDTEEWQKEEGRRRRRNKPVMREKGKQNTEPTESALTGAFLWALTRRFQTQNMYRWSANFLNFIKKKKQFKKFTCENIFLKKNYKKIWIKLYNNLWVGFV